MKAVSSTEEIVAALRAKHSGREWVCFPELRLGSGYGGKWEQRIDVWAMSCYPSRGLQSISYEVKVSRSDFLRELKRPEKRRAAMEMSNLFFFAAPAGLIQPDELPPDCGLVELRRGTLRTICNATFRDREPLPWRFLASVARRVVAAGDVPEYVDFARTDLTGLGESEIGFLARTVADANSVIVQNWMTNEQAAIVLERAVTMLRKQAQ